MRSLNVFRSLPAGRPRGLEQAFKVQAVECLAIDAVCDACGGEIPAGSQSRYVFRIGALHCARCAGLAVEAA